MFVHKDFSESQRDKMEPILVLILLSLAMLVGCYIAGSIPLIMPMSEVWFCNSSPVDELPEWKQQYTFLICQSSITCT